MKWSINQKLLTIDGTQHTLKKALSERQVAHIIATNGSFELEDGKYLFLG